MKALLCAMPVIVHDFAMVGNIAVAMIQYAESGEPEIIPVSALSFFQPTSKEVN